MKLVVPNFVPLVFKISITVVNVKKIEFYHIVHVLKELNQIQILKFVHNVHQLFANFVLVIHKIAKFVKEIELEMVVAALITPKVIHHKIAVHCVYHKIVQAALLQNLFAKHV